MRTEDYKVPGWLAGGHLLCPDPPTLPVFVTCKEITNYRLVAGYKVMVLATDQVLLLLLAGCLLIVPAFTDNYFPPTPSSLLPHSNWQTCSESCKASTWNFPMKSNKPICIIKTFQTDLPMFSFLSSQYYVKGLEHNWRYNWEVEHIHCLAWTAGHIYISHLVRLCWWPQVALMIFPACCYNNRY